jgi:uncharacterized protein YaaR (DUF327 family)
MNINVSPALPPDNANFQKIGEMKISNNLLMGTTTVTQRIRYEGREYNVFVRVDGKLSKQEAETTLGQAIDKTMTLAVAFKLGGNKPENPSSLKIYSDGKVSLHKGGQTINHEKASNILDEKMAKTENKLVQSHNDTKNDQTDRLLKLENKINNLENAKLILGEHVSQKKTAETPPPVPARDDEALNWDPSDGKAPPPLPPRDLVPPKGQAPTPPPRSDNMVNTPSPKHSNLPKDPRDIAPNAQAPTPPPRKDSNAPLTKDQITQLTGTLAKAFQEAAEEDVAKETPQTLRKPNDDINQSELDKLLPNSLKPAPKEKPLAKQNTHVNLNAKEFNSFLEAADNQHFETKMQSLSSQLLSFKNSKKTPANFDSFKNSINRLLGELKGLKETDRLNYDLRVSLLRELFKQGKQNSNKFPNEVQKFLNLNENALIDEALLEQGIRMRQSQQINGQMRL